ncbi:MAG: acyl-CoA dehydratase activase [Candidatus Omnitrophica bacterium]|nr:acyl-CoA dehydratase activase [Candidatus Omnitrophota bacterium]MCM8802643.1 acyl-CoA dehydratase activase [Candidatus Omnitrophota bacterium]
MIKAGIDIGSVTTKCVIVKDGVIFGKAITKTPLNIEKAIDNVLQKAIEEAGIKEEEIKEFVSTGYGRKQCKKANRFITEISAVAKGGHIFGGKKSCLIIDVGGQDTKVVEVNDRGLVTGFLMNDKCAAGTGRFIEIMSNILETDINGFSSLAMSSKNPIKINSTCSVFAESEVISLITSLTPREDIAAGLFNSIALRITTMVRQFKNIDRILFCGGGAKIPALKYYLEKNIEKELFVLHEPQFVSAYGAAMIE